MNANSIRFAPIISAGLLDAIADREAYQAWYPEYCDYRVSRMLNGREVMEWAWLRGYNPWPELPAYAALVA